MNIPESFQGSPTLQLVQSQGWNFKISGSNIILEHCVWCQKPDHMYLEIHGALDGQQQRDGLFMCQRCGASGNLYKLKQKLGLAIAGVSSTKEWAASKQETEQLPDVDACHQALMDDEQALDYLCNIRGFSLDIIQRQKIGLTKHYFKATGKDTKALVYPYLVNDNIVWAKFRTLPDPSDLKKVPKDFTSPKGWDSTLYNINALQEGCKEITLVEGEANVIAALDKDIDGICGVPGANSKKADWIDKLDNVEKVYICYDKDTSKKSNKAGQKAAQAMASRIGIQKCYKIVLPDFTIVTEDGSERLGKDLNEWFVHGGGTKEEWEKLKENAQLFDVDGVASEKDALDEFMEELEGHGAGSKYVWPLIADIAQFDEGDVIDILAPEKIGKTTLGLNLMEYMVDTYGEDGIIICTEMTRAKLARKWVSHKAQIADNQPKNPDEAAALTYQFKEVIPQLKEMAASREGNLYFCYPKYKTMDDVYKLIIDCIRRYGVKWIMVDNLQRLCDTTIGSRNRTQWLSEISKTLQQIAKDYGVQLVRILQPHRIGEGKLATSDSVDGASQVGKDCDWMLVANRNRIGEVTKKTFEQGGFIQSDCTFGPEMLLTCGLARYGAGGTTTLYYNGATSTVHKLTEGKIASMQAKANENVGYAAVKAALNMPSAEGDNVKF